jgi:transmembrane sensor
MISNDERLRSAIAEQAGEWFVANEETRLDAGDSEALAAWLKTSPVHIEEFLGVSAIARDLREARTDPEYSLEAVLARARAERYDPPVQCRWHSAIVAMAACAVLSLGSLLTWNVRLRQSSVPEGITALRFETRHGEQLSRRLADNSVLHLNTDSAVTIRYGKSDRVVVLTSGQAEFEVAHESDRPFRVLAGSAEVVDVGTKFDVRLQQDSTVVTVVEGRVAVGRSALLNKLSADPSDSRLPGFVELSADQHMRLAEGEWPATPVAVDAQRTTALATQRNRVRPRTAGACRSRIQSLHRQAD